MTEPYRYTLQESLTVMRRESGVGAVQPPAPAYTQSLIDWLLMPPNASTAADESAMRSKVAAHLHLLSRGVQPPAPEPVAEVIPNEHIGNWNNVRRLDAFYSLPAGTMLYATPPTRERES